MDSYAHAVSNAPSNSIVFLPNSSAFRTKTLWKQKQFRCDHWSWDGQTTPKAHNYTNRESAKSSNNRMPSQLVPFGVVQFLVLVLVLVQILLNEACSWPLKAALSFPSEKYVPSTPASQFIFGLCLRRTSLGTNFPISHTILHRQQPWGGKFTSSRL